MPFIAFANKIDSLKSVLLNSKNEEKIAALKSLISIVPDEEKAHFYNELAEQYLANNPIKSFYFAKKAKVLAQKLNQEKELAYSLTKIAYLYFIPKLKYDSATYNINKAIKILEKYGNSNELGLAYNYAGIFQADQGKLNTGLNYFNKAEQIYLSIGNYCRAATLHHNIGKLNKYSKSPDEVKKYFMESLEMYKKHNCEENYDFLYTNLSEIYIEQKKYVLAKEALLKALEIAKKKNDIHSIGVCFFSLGELNMHLDTSKAIKYLFKAKVIADSVKIVKLQTAVSIELAKYFLTIHKPDTAKKYIDDAMEKAKNSNKLFYLQQSYNLLSKYYENKGNFKKALKYFKLNTTYKDSIGAEKVKVKIMTLENDKKENQINLLNKENELIHLQEKRSRIYAYLISLIMLLSVIISYFLFKNYKHKQNVKKMEIHRKSEQKILELERTLLNSVIQTEDKERKRIAADLHDDLGPLLSSIKLYLGEIEFVNKSERKLLLNQIIELIDKSIKDIRNITRNLVPESFAEKGLISALHSFINRIKFSKIIDIEFENHIDKCNYNRGFEIIIFRIIAELINNTLRHANAKSIHIKLTEDNKNITISYKDNGMGFNVEEILKRKNIGLGLKNIKERVYSLGGKLAINSSKEQGTDIHIELGIIM